MYIYCRKTIIHMVEIIDKYFYYLWNTDDRVSLHMGFLFRQIDR